MRRPAFLWFSGRMAPGCGMAILVLAVAGCTSAVAPRPPEGPRLGSAPQHAPPPVPLLPPEPAAETPPAPPPGVPGGPTPFDEAAVAVPPAGVPILWVHRPHPAVVAREAGLEQVYTAMIAEPDRAAKDRAAALIMRSRSRARLWQPEAALADVDAAIGLVPGSAMMHLERAALLGALGRAAEAAAPLQTAFRREPDSAATAAVLGVLRFQEGRHLDAAEALRFHVESGTRDRSMVLLGAMADLRAARRPEFSRLGTLRDPWPGAIGSFLAHRIERPALLALARAELSAPAAEVACQTRFYLGEQALLEGDRERAVRDFLGALESGWTPAIEYRLAAAELIRLGVLDARSLPGRRAE